ncbi:MAG: twin-arginine translocation signal domain-containing protein [Anaerolineae bacterium]|nr:twin-arginine translocation signal domain-containing protein [Anaerolineae bacterium]MCI0609911.1 twin-arginine translocation signal domain-containing protein [Anaerolineae bacterium]
MKLSRRDFLKFGGVTLIAVAGGTVLRALDQGVFSVGQGAAYEPWTNWRDAPTPTERIVAAGILASNPHNSQPWIFRITDSTIDLFAEPERQIGVIDPFLREMYVGLGCAVENMMLAAEAEGLSPTLGLMPDPTDETHAAHLELIHSSPHPSKLYSVIPNRHTDRGAYDTARSIAPKIFEEIEVLIAEANLHLFWYKDEAARAQFSEVAIESVEALIADEQQSMDSHAWWRQDWDQLQETADGITLDAQALGPITPIAKIFPDLSRQQNDAAFVKNVREIMLPTAAAFGILAVRDGNNSTQRLNCGRAWERIHLWGTTQGLAMQPLNQMCERVDREIQLGIEPVIGNAVRALVNDDSWHAIMPFRLGYPTQKTNLSPRRGLGKVIA